MRLSKNQLLLLICKNLGLTAIEKKGKNLQLGAAATLQNLLDS